MERNLRKELLENVDCIYLPNGEWWRPERPLLPVWDGDVWSFSREVLLRPEFKQGFSVMMHSAENRGDCVASGDGWANFVVEHITYRATGDLFDWNDRFFDRETRPKDPKDEKPPCAVLGESPRHTMNRLRKRIDNPSTRLSSERLLSRLCAYAWAWKVYAARAGRPESCEMRVI